MISITFTKNGTGDSGTYGISSIAGMAEVVVEKKSKYVHFSGSYSNPLMVTPINNSFTCATNEPISLNSTFSDKKAEFQMRIQQNLAAFSADPSSSTTTPARTKKIKP